jgi:DNA ligase 1
MVSLILPKQAAALGNPLPFKGSDLAGCGVGMGGSTCVDEPSTIPAAQNRHFCEHICQKMRAFSNLYDALDASTKTLAKVDAMRSFFASAPHADCAWAAYVLAGGRPKRVIATARLRSLAQEAAGVPEWLFEASYQMAGDLAETIAHLLPASHTPTEMGLNDWMTARILPLRGLDEAAQKSRVLEDWSQLDASGRFLYVKLIGGGFRVGVAKGLVVRAIAEACALEPKLIAQRMMGFTSLSRTPSAADFAALIEPQVAGESSQGGAPYPFYLAHPIPGAPEAECGDISAWQIEWKYDGIRAQAVRRGGETFLWSRGEELVNETFPDVIAALNALPDGTVIDGELLVWRGDQPAPFADLQKRLGRKVVSKATQQKLPVKFVAYDCLEICSGDIREKSLILRRRYLEDLLLTIPEIIVSKTLQLENWSAANIVRATARSQRAEGFMLKRLDAPYGAGRTGNGWWKWKLEPYAVDAILTYAQRGHGRRAGLYTDYTFGVWTRAPRDEAEAALALSMPPSAASAQGLPTLLTFAKAYSGLTDEEIKAVDKVIKDTTLEDFGPVRAVRPALVMELGFEGIGASPRHKSGVAVRFPRILRMRSDKPLHEADTLASLKNLIAHDA